MGDNVVFTAARWAQPGVMFLLPLLLIPPLTLPWSGVITIFGFSSSIPHCDYAFFSLFSFYLELLLFPTQSGLTMSAVPPTLLFLLPSSLSTLPSWPLPFEPSAIFVIDGHVSLVLSIPCLWSRHRTKPSGFPRPYPDGFFNLESTFFRPV